MNGHSHSVHSFEGLLDSFSRQVAGAKYVAVDTELTGIDNGTKDNYEDEANERLDKLCDVAERHVLTQLGLTIARDNGAGSIIFSSFSVLAFPKYRERFECTVRSLRFMREHGLDFNAWIDEGVPYISRAEAQEKGFLKPSGEIHESAGLLRLWQVLIDSKIPVVFHGPLDLFFLLSSFETRKLPRGRQELGRLIRSNFACIYDTALTHLLVPALQAKPQKLVELYRSARACHERSQMQAQCASLQVSCEAETQRRYGCSLSALTNGTCQSQFAGQHGAHEAGFDSLLTALLFAYLWALAGNSNLERVQNRLFLYRSCECLDLNRLAERGDAAADCHEGLDGTVLVASAPNQEAKERATDLIANAGADKYFYRKIDETRTLVFVSGQNDVEIVENAKNLAKELPGVVWQGVCEWKETIRKQKAQMAPATQGHYPRTVPSQALGITATTPNMHAGPIAIGQLRTIPSMHAAPGPVAQQSVQSQVGLALQMQTMQTMQAVQSFQAAHSTMQPVQTVYPVGPLHPPLRQQQLPTVQALSHVGGRSGRGRRNGRGGRQGNGGESLNGLPKDAKQTPASDAKRKQAEDKSTAYSGSASSSARDDPAQGAAFAYQ